MLIGRCCNLDIDTMSGQQRFNFFGPFDEAQMPRIEVFFRANVKGFGFVFESVAVEVINNLALHGAVLVDNRKSGTLHVVLHAQLLANGLDERGFARAHVSLKTPN